MNEHKAPSGDMRRSGIPILPFESLDAELARGAWLARFYLKDDSKEVSDVTDVRIMCPDPSSKKMNATAEFGETSIDRSETQGYSAREQRLDWQATLIDLEESFSSLASKKSLADATISVCIERLKADAACLFDYRENDDSFAMTAEKGCTETFVNKWKTIPRATLSLLRGDKTQGIFFVGSGEAFTDEFPTMAEEINRSGRRAVAVAPLATNGKIHGILGFSFNRPMPLEAEQPFVLGLAELYCRNANRLDALEHERNLRRDSEAGNESKINFIADVSHELRSPIAVIQGFVDLLLNEKLSAEARNYASIIKRNVDHLSSLTDGLLDLSKIEASAADLCFQPVDLAALIEDVAAASSIKAREFETEVRISTFDLCEAFDSDPVRLKQIIFNMVSNAIKFSDKKPVDVEFGQIDGDVVVSVTDRGHGIPDSLHDEIFQAFNRVDMRNKRKFAGTGLGLAISRKLARAMGGDLSLVRSKLGQGSTFRLRLPPGERREGRH